MSSIAAGSITDRVAARAVEVPPRPAVAAARRVVLKMGTRVLTHDNGRLALARLFGIVETAATLLAEGREVLLVSSGAVGLGRDALGLEETPRDLDLRQACAAIGQTRLMALYQDGFTHFGRVCGQVLLTQSDFDDRRRYLNLRRALSTLLERGAVPIINENDAVSTEELALVETADPKERPIFGDNDRLSALVAAKLDADLLILLTDVAGLYDRNPREDPSARLLGEVREPEDVLAVAGGSGSDAGRGGMRSKVEAAAVAMQGGCQTVIVSGRDPDALPRALRGEDVGTWFPAREGLRARDRWIAFAAAPRGVLRLDAGAVEALRDGRASLLAAGVVKVEGEFRVDDVVELRAPDGGLLGRGRIPWDAETVRAWCGGEPPPGTRNAHCLIRRNHLVLRW